MNTQRGLTENNRQPSKFAVKEAKKKALKKCFQGFLTAVDNIDRVS